MAVESPLTSPLSVTDGTFKTQLAVAFYEELTQRVEIALAATAEYVINQESSSDTNYADRALFARMLASNPAYWAQALALLIAADSATISATCSDQAILNRIWTIYPVVAYKASTVLYASGGISGG